MWPLLLRPPVRRSGSSSDFSGSLFVTSAKSETERNRVPGVIGRNCRMPMSALEHGDRVAFFERSEEHTSELQSLAYLVCRLLLEKKKKNKEDSLNSYDTR